MGGKWAWIKRTEPNEEGERFVIARKAKHRNGFVDYWHLKNGHVYLYTFLPNAKFNKRTSWNQEMYLELEKELQSPNPSIKVVRYAVDGQLIFLGDNGGGRIVPAMPDAPKKPEGWERHLEKQARKAMLEDQQKTEAVNPKPNPGVMGNRKTENPGTPKKKMNAAQRAEIEAIKGQEKAPYRLYGKFTEDEEDCAEFVWKLNPDKPKRQGIKPGDRVLAWTENGFAKVYCTRIERVDMRRKQPEHPKYRVKKKI